MRGNRRRRLCLATVSLAGCASSVPAALPGPAPASAPAPESKRAEVSVSADLAALWARLGQTKLAPTRVDTPIDIFPLLELSPDGTRIHAYRHREMIDYGSYLDLVEIDLAAGGSPHVLADTGVDTYLLEYVGDTLFATRSVKEYETHRVLRFDISGPTRALDEPSDPAEVEWFAATPDGLIYHVGAELYGLAPGASPVKLMSSTVGRLGNIVALGHQQLIASSRLSENIDDERHVHALVSWGPGFSSPRAAELLTEDFGFDIIHLNPWTAHEALAVATRDSNGDGRTNYEDRGTGTICALNLDSGALRPIVGGELDIGALRPHASGLFIYVDVDVARAHNRVVVHNPVDEVDHELDVLGGTLVNWSLDAGWTRIVYAEVLDSDGDGNRYDWEDQSKLFVSPL